MEKVDALHSVVASHQHMMEMNQRSLRRNNIIISGIEETSENENIEEVISSFFLDRLGVPDVQIQKATRLGRKGGSNRLILVVMVSFGEKLKVLRQKQSLKGTKIYLNDDLTPDQRVKRKQLWQMCLQARRDGKSAFIKIDKVVVNNVEMSAYPTQDSLMHNNSVNGNANGSVLEQNTS